MDHSIDECRKRGFISSGYNGYVYTSLCEEHILKDISSFNQDTLNYFLLTCVRIGTLPILKKLIEHGANVNTTDKKNETVLYIACFHCKYTFIEELLKHSNIYHSLNIKSIHGSTPFSLLCSCAIDENGRECMKLFIKSGLVSEKEIIKLRKYTNPRNIAILNEWENYTLLEIKEPDL